jgi:hypothetical protein
MALPLSRPSTATVGNLTRSAGALAGAATARMAEQLAWYRDLSAQERAWVAVVAQAGIASFAAWCLDPDTEASVTADVFGTAPRELTGSVSLRQTLDLVRTVVDVVEEHAAEVAIPSEEADLVVAVLYYSREIAFAAAQVYASAAESRGAWDARLESLAVDALLRGETDDEVVSQAAALGWSHVSPVAVVVGASPSQDLHAGVEALRRAVTRLGAECLIAVQGHRVVIVLGGAPDPLAAAAALLPHVGPGPLVVGPPVAALQDAGVSAAAALSGWRAAPGWAQAPRPALADDLLPERALVGEDVARAALIAQVHDPLRAAGAPLWDTAASYLAGGRSLEAAARELFVHPNTVRYRLGRIAQVTGYDLSDPREAYVAQVALSLGRLRTAAAGESHAGPVL